MDDSTFEEFNLLLGGEREFLTALIKHQVKFLVVGGYAVHFHGYHRELDDLDVLAPNNDENFPKICKAIEEEPTPYSYTIKPGQVGKAFNHSLKTCWNGDIITQADGIDFDEAYARRCMVQIPRMEIPIIGKCDLIKMKLAAYKKFKSERQQDWDDVQALKKYNVGRSQREK
jgi:hypothetical protein